MEGKLPLRGQTDASDDVPILNEDRVANSPGYRRKKEGPRFHGGRII
jgi:hypothetical protein